MANASVDEIHNSVCRRACDIPRIVSGVRNRDRTSPVGVTKPVEIQATSEVVASKATQSHFIGNLQTNLTAFSFSAERARTEATCKNPNKKAPAHTEKKPWMDYRAVTDTSSVQYELLSRAYHADNGLLYVDGYLCVALGQQFGEVGDVFVFQMDTGETIEVIMADAKMNCHTIDGWTGTDGHLIEMIVDTDYLDNEAMVMGDCNCLVPGTVISFERKEQ